MRFEWDGRKNRSNEVKHGIGFELAALVFDDPHAISLLDNDGIEERWLTVGLVKAVLAVAVVHTWRDENNEEVIRIISARKATSSERYEYENRYKKA